VIVPREAAGIRLDRFLATALAELGDPPSRAEVQRWLELGAVRVDGSVASAKDKTRVGSRVEVDRPPPRSTELVPDPGVPFEVLHVDDAIVVIVKPAGVVVHPAAGHDTGTLVHGLLARGWFDLDVFASNDNSEPSERLRPGIVHRLDKGTSGVMVVARTAAAREGLKAQFEVHSVERAYHALTAGVAASQTHATLHGRHPQDRLTFTGRVRTGKRAVTHVRLISALFGDRASLVECTLETGRTHQIRMHLAESKTPVLGDPVYGKPPRDEALRALAAGLTHQALHARVLGFVHPVTGQKMRFEAAPPPDFQAALSFLSKDLGADV
jgi:23S rRNA pseudouridine1911/1915/1917 synthase